MSPLLLERDGIIYIDYFNCYLVNVMMSVAIEISVPTDDIPSDNAGGTFQDARALELLGST